MKVYKATVLIYDYEGYGPQSAIDTLENNRYVSASVRDIEERELEWSDDHPLNKLDQWEAAFDELFGLAAKRHAAEVAAPSGASVEGDARDAARMSYMRAKHVMGASYGGMVTLSVIVRSDDYAMGGIDWALDCQTEAIAAMSPNKEG